MCMLTENLNKINLSKFIDKDHNQIKEIENENLMDF